MDDPTFARMALGILVVAGGMCAHCCNHTNAYQRFPIPLGHVDSQLITDHDSYASTDKHAHLCFNFYSHSNSYTYAHSNTNTITIANGDADTRTQRHIHTRAHPNATAD